MIQHIILFADYWNVLFLERMCDRLTMPVFEYSSSSKYSNASDQRMTAYLLTISLCLFCLMEELSAFSKKVIQKVEQKSTLLRILQYYETVLQRTRVVPYSLVRVVCNAL
jgi:hypothetical protein